MAEPSQQIILIIKTLTVVLFWAVAAIFLGRKVRPEYKRPTVMFGLWWLIGGLLIATGIVSTILAEYGIYVRIPTAYVTWALLPFALFCLLYYTLFLFTGREKWMIPLAVFYGAIIIALLVIGTVSGPYFDEETGKVEYVRSSLASYAGLISVVAVALPQIFVCIALYVLYFKLDQPTQKYRIFMIATGIFIWVFSSMIASIFNLSTIPMWPVIGSFTVMLAGLTAYLAYKPPAFIKKRGVISIDDEVTKSAQPGGK